MLMHSRQDGVRGLEHSSGPLPVTPSLYLGLWVLVMGTAAEGRVPLATGWGEELCPPGTWKGVFGDTLSHYVTQGVQVTTQPQFLCLQNDLSELL